MSIWILLWLLLSLVMVYFLGWNLVILFRQKAAWKQFSQKYGLRYKDDKFMETPRLDGVIKDYPISVFASEHTADNARTTRKLSAVEIQLSSKMPFDGAVASGGMVEPVKALGFSKEIKPNLALWKDDYIAVTSHRVAMADYLTEPRMKALNTLMAMKHAWVILAFRNDLFVLRVDTPNPLDATNKLDFLIKKMLKAAAVLELTEGEADALLSSKAKSSPVVQVLDGGDDIGGLELEDDDQDGGDEEE